MGAGASPSNSDSSPPLRGILGFIERLGNKLPDPVFLFLGATVLVAVLSAVGAGTGWSVQPQRPRVVMESVVENGVTVQRPKEGPDGRPVLELASDGAPVGPRSLLSADGIYWLTSNMIRNFINFPPLGVVLVGMIGIGVAEKVGLFGALMKWVASLVPSKLLTPTVVCLGILSNVASDAGYIILPPLAAGLYVVYGRPALAGIAAAFAGVSAGFSANLLVAATDALVAGITEAGARVLDPQYTVLATCNWWFMAVSTLLLTLVGWGVTAWIVEPRLRAQQQGADVAAPPGDSALEPTERRGLRWALTATFVVVGAIGAVLFIPGAPLAGQMPAPAPTFGPIPAAPASPPGTFKPSAPISEFNGPVQGTAELRRGFSFEANGSTVSGESVRGTFRLSGDAAVVGSLAPPPAPQPRWSQAIVPIILVAFLVPGLAYGIATGSVRSASDVTKAIIHAMGQMAPVIAMAFFAAQFIACFQYSQLDRMLAFAGGDALVSLGLPPMALLVGIILLTMTVNLLMSSMSAKWTMLAPILVPMMMMVGMSPELTQCAYRVGDSVTNIITPLNSYAIVILAAMQRYSRSAGMGNLIALMLPYSVWFFIVWTLFILGWVALGIEPGPNAPLWYTPGHAH